MAYTLGGLGNIYLYDPFHGYSERYWVTTKNQCTTKAPGGFLSQNGQQYQALIRPGLWEP